VAKYEDILLQDYKELSSKKATMVEKIDAAAYNLYRLKMIDKHLKEQDWILIRSIFMWKKVKQLVRLERRAQRKFVDLFNEFVPINRKLIDIRETLFKYYDKQIEECIDGLGMKEVQTLQDLLLLSNGYDTDTTGLEE